MIIGKVVDDNGYKIEIIRPLKDIPMSVGTKVEINICKDGIDLIKLFNEFIDDATKDRLIQELSNAKAAV